MLLKTTDINIERLGKIVDQLVKNPNPIVNMESTIRPTATECGCFAGELSVAMDKLNVYNDSIRFNYSNELKRFIHYISYKNGLFEEWAHNNPNIWGNEYGRLMFESPSSFGVIGDTFLSKAIIIEHLRKVIFNIKQIQNSENKHENNVT